MAVNVQKLIRDVKDFLQDEPILNVLLDRREFSDTMVKLAIRLMISDFNRLVFASRYNEASFPPEEQSFVSQLYGTVYHLLNMGATLQIRNHLPYNDGGTSVGQFSKSGEYLGVAERFKELFIEAGTQLKYDINIEMGYGGVSTEYAYFGGWSTIHGHSF